MKGGFTALYSSSGARGRVYQVPFKPPALDIPAEGASDARDASQCDALFLSECTRKRERSDMPRCTRIKHLRTLDCEARVLHGDCLKSLRFTVFRHSEIFLLRPWRTQFCSSFASSACETGHTATPADCPYPWKLFVCRFFARGSCHVEKEMSSF